MRGKVKNGRREARIFTSPEMYSLFYFLKSVRVVKSKLSRAKEGRQSRDIAEMLKTYQVNKTLDERKRIYDMCAEEKFNFLLIDQEAEPEEQLKKNFMELIE